MRYTVLEIYEDDHGCEGIQPGEEPMNMVYARGEDGKERWLRIPERDAESLKPGDRIEYEK